MNGKQLAVILAIIGAAALLFSTQTSSKVSEFESWKSNHGVSYASEFENAYRERIFIENLAKIESHNSNKQNTYEMGLNQFSAMTQEEFVQTYLGVIATPETNTIEVQEENVKIGDVDWTTKSGVVTGVKNQGQCGSCWAFSATGGLEGLWGLASSPQSFSEQELVDCSRSYGNQGCNGGLMDSAFKYVIAKGIALESAYPYTAKDGTCKGGKGDNKITGFTDIQRGSISDLGNQLAGRPISVAVDASNWSPYKSGIFSNCGTSLNHGVLLVGSTTDYWRVKNSWGTSWGESGFIRLKLANTCGIANMASYPTK